MNDTAMHSDNTTMHSDEPFYFQSNSPVRTFIPAVKSLLRNPAAYFAGLPFQVFFGNSLFFVSIVIFLSIFLAVPFYTIGIMFLIPFIWGLLLIGMWFMSMYINWAMKSFGGGKITPANAYQVTAYAFVPMALVGVSWLGVLAFTANIYLMWLGLKEYCKVPGGRAAAVLVVPVILAGLFGGALLFALSHLAPLGN